MGFDGKRAIGKAAHAQQRFGLMLLLREIMVIAMAATAAND
jgi:hypothetical protein